eukprot:TRINITY_DN76067_c0_g1_i1.p1 TRINITY_DN76067_c0_g1~~TRINITY_DN76067_c0_g1_i1.p1  ORF type:complete len:213 (-),score=31.13 TRINITY_DN76067_c0_g1_i1:15-653(-)
MQSKHWSSPSSRPSTPPQPLRSVASLVAEAEEVLGETVQLKDQLARQRRDGRRRRSDHARHVAEAMRSHGDSLRIQREKLEAQLGDTVRRIHELEVHSMDASSLLRERRHDVRSLARNMVALKRVNVNVNEMAGGEFRALRDMHIKLAEQHKGFEADLQVSYEKKEQVEAEISECRQVLAVNDGLGASRAELPHARRALQEMEAVAAAEALR